MNNANYVLRMTEDIDVHKNPFNQKIYRGFGFTNKKPCGLFTRKAFLFLLFFQVKELQGHI